MIIISDAQRYDTMRFMPETQALIGDQGVMFTRAYATTPLCCPSRSSILTGLYAHNHQVRNNFDELSVKTIVQALHENGYRTALTGKYLNSYPVYLGPPLPEFDLWITYDKPTYYDPMLAVGSTWETVPAYLTDILRDHALEFIRENVPGDDPFLLVYAPWAPHLPSVPGENEAGQFEDMPPHRLASLNEDDMSDKPHWLQQEPLLSEERAAMCPSALSWPVIAGAQSAPLILWERASCSGKSPLRRNPDTIIATMIIILMGVAGSGKTTIGRMLAEDLNWSFHDADDFHPPENVRKMGQGIPLTDVDRQPWLEAIAALSRDLLMAGQPAVITCSALKRTYRQVLCVDPDQIQFVYLKADYAILLRRLHERKDHFMKPEMLRSQFETLEEPHDALIVDADRTPEVIIQDIKQRLALA